MLLLALLVLYCGTAVSAEPMPTAPTPELIATANKRPQPALSFRDFLHDRDQMTAFGLAFGAKSFDLGQTLWHRANCQRFHEDWMPMQTPAGISLGVLGSEAGATFLQYRLYSSGHKRLAIATQILSGGASAVAIAYSFGHVTIMHFPPTPPNGGTP